MVERGASVVKKKEKKEQIYERSQASGCAPAAPPPLHLHGDMHTCACFCEAEQRIERKEGGERAESFPHGGEGKRVFPL